MGPSRISSLAVLADTHTRQRKKRKWRARERSEAFLVVGIQYKSQKIEIHQDRRTR